MPLTTAVRLAKRHPARIGVAAGLLAAPYVALAAAGDLVAASVPVAFLLGIALVALAAYLASALAHVVAPQSEAREAGRRGCDEALAVSSSA